ncbi:hypothetical protein [uncultured Cyclobacterium sp.]|uniref:hypothetical protein n=1 Tax=uncultured Cyclobacterium sp. TaxID=453820 RepID=UPI0030EC1FFD|tara:strand:+ start:114101 stop:114943 length:843 start_codon:yes stop_codon:yes gene_type:complete
MKELNKTFIVKPFGGLGNRMRVISSFLFLKKMFNAKLKIIWLANDELNANYFDLFQEHPDFEVLKDLGSFKYVKTSYQKSLFKKKVAKLINFLIGIDYCVFDSDMHKGYDEVVSIINDNNVIFFNTCEEVYQFNEGLRSIKIRSDLETRLARILVNLNFDKKTFGIHVRRTDHNIAIKSSPLILFEEVLDNEFKNDLELKAYIASDDISVISELKLKYKGRIVFMSKVFGRDTKEGIVDGLIELYLLSKTSKIYGSYWSSYSKIAGRLSGVPVISLQIEN